MGLAWAQFCSWAHWVQFFLDKKLHIGKYNIFISITPLSVGQGRWEWVDGAGWTQMTFHSDYLILDNTCWVFILHPLESSHIDSSQMGIFY